MTDRREVWITGVGLLTCLGEGLEAAWLALDRGDPPPYDDKTFAPNIVFPMKPMNFDKQIAKKSDQRQMETWQRVGVYAAGLALSDAGVAGNAELLDHTDMIISASGGERDIAVDTAILTGMRKTEHPGAFLNEHLMSDLRPTLFLAQLPNMLAGNISLVHGVTGASRTFLGEEAAGLDAVRIAQARIATAQSEVALVGGAYHGARWDAVINIELSGILLKPPFAPVWDRGPKGGVTLATMGAFLVLESRDHALARGARPRARIGRVFSDSRARGPGEIESTLHRLWKEIAPDINGGEAAIISAASGAEPATSAELSVLTEIGLPVRNPGTYIGHGLDAQFVACLAIACGAIEHAKLFASAGSGDRGDSPAALRQTAVTSVGTWRGEGMTLLERVD